MRALFLVTRCEPATGSCNSDALLRRSLLTVGCPFPWGAPSVSNTWFLGPTRVARTNGISIISAVFAGLTNVINRWSEQPTNRDTPCVAIGHYRYMRPNNNANNDTNYTYLCSSMSPAEAE